MRLIQPYPNHSSPIIVRPEDKVDCPVPVYFNRYRYPHHAVASGYDRLCDYVGQTIPLSRTVYWLGETLLRLAAIAVAKYGGHFEYSRYDFTMELEVIRHFLRHHNSVYHFVYGEKSYNLLSHFAGRNGNKIVVTIHHPPEHNAWLFRSLDHFKKADSVIVVSRSMISFWREMVGDEKVAYVPYAVDASYFVPRAVSVAPRPRRCLFIGCHERDFEILPALVARILQDQADLEFLMLSSDKRCRRVVESNSRALWYERVTDADYLNYLQQSDVLVLPLRRSTTNTAVLEAMACGLPVVTNRGGIEDYLDARSSVVLPVGDVQGMVAAVHRLLTQPEERAAMSKAAREQACQFSWTATARTMMGIYSRLLFEGEAASHG